ncbi:MAG: polysaccharide ABC transporter ATP-binding protein [Candidatus Methylacidiphilales bacterium]|nr:polysaccharide ABC transporter ATP-binding protein [Candidatus Methylacidiphilales bacterium]
MSAPVISVENLGKDYILTHQGGEASYRTLRETLSGLFRKPEPKNRKSEIFQALNDVSFEVRQGEVLGIIGRNGAGKSTLLKILSRITEPTRGRVRLRGRVASLLEVGTGFHPELTGRENIFLNGAILGMNRAEIRNKFDEIVAFAEVEKFLDTPVKHYSSGMYVRLAFAVAAHLEPEILIIDEVLAVGDTQFQKKCLGKMQSVSKNEGRSVLFVSHNLGIVSNLCSRVLLLKSGQLALQGPPGPVIAESIGTIASTGGRISWENDPIATRSNLSIRSAQIVCEGRTCVDVPIDREVVLEIEIEAMQAENHLSSSIHLFDKQGTWVLCSGLKSASYQPGRYLHRYHLPANFLNDGRYTFNIMLVRDATRIEVHIPDAISFFVHETGSGRDDYGGTINGCIRPHLQTESLRLTD